MLGWFSTGCGNKGSSCASDIAFLVEILGFCIDIDNEYFLPLSSFWLYATIFSPLKLAAHCHQCR